MESKQFKSLNEAIRNVVEGKKKKKLAGTQKQVDILLDKNMKMIDKAKKKLVKEFRKYANKQSGLDIEDEFGLKIGWHKKRNQTSQKRIKDGLVVVSNKEVEDDAGWSFSCYADEYEMGTTFESPSGMSGNEEGDLKYEIENWVEELTNEIEGYIEDHLS